MLKLPPVDHPARELFDMAHLAEIARPDNVGKIPTFREARTQAEKAFASAGKAIRALHYLLLRADGTLQLWRFGPKGGRCMIWNFGPAVRP